jgi:hypothetical protein
VGTAEEADALRELESNHKCDKWKLEVIETTQSRRRSSRLVQ